MRRLVAFAAIVCLLACFPAMMAGQTTVFKFVNDGSFAKVTQTTGLSNFTLMVSNGFTSGSGATASLQFSSFSIAADFSSITFTNAFGPIPPTSLTGQNTNNIAVNVDTSTLGSTFFSESCTLSLVTFILTCGAGPTGVVNLQFTQQKNGQSIAVLASNVETTNGPVVIRTHQKSDQTTATVSGSIFGTAVPSSVSAVVGISHMSSIQFDHTP